MIMLQRKLLAVLLQVLVLAPSCVSFRPESVIRHQQSTTTALSAWFPDEGVEAARGAVPLWFFGAAGSGGVARSALPGIIDEWKEVQQLGGLGPTKGGPTLGINPLCGYPQDVSIADVEDIINSKMTVEQIIKKYEIEGNKFSGNYLTIDAWTQANEGKNPLAARVIFDSFGKSSVVEPSIAIEKLEEYRANPKVIAPSLAAGKFTVFLAVFALLFLLGLADVATATDAYRGYFHEWPGGNDFPWSVFTEEGGAIWTIPQYWDASPIE